MINKEEQAKYIKNLRDKLRLSQRNFGKEFNVSGSYIAQVETGQSALSEKVYNLIQKKYNNLADDKQIQETISGWIYPEVFGSCGNGTFELSQERYPIQIPKDYFFKNINPIKMYSVINAYGDSMNPLINDGDKLIVEHLEAGEQIQDNRIYVFCYDNRVSVKRLIYNVDEIVIKSDNPDKETYKTKYIEKSDMNNLYIIGQIVGLARDLR